MKARRRPHPLCKAIFCLHKNEMSELLYYNSVINVYKILMTVFFMNFQSWDDGHDMKTWTNHEALYPLLG